MLSLLTLLLLTLLLLYSWAEPNGPSSPHLHLSLPGVLPTWTTWSWLQCVAATHGTDDLALGAAVLVDPVGLANSA